VEGLLPQLPAAGPALPTGQPSNNAYAHAILRRKCVCASTGTRPRAQSRFTRPRLPAGSQDRLASAPAYYAETGLPVAIARGSQRAAYA
jgi:hypothetical protein